MVTFNSISCIKKHIVPTVDTGNQPAVIQSMTDAFDVFTKALKAAKIPTVLLYGTCLGMVRDQKIIDYDTDIDLGVFLTDFTAIYAIIPDLQQQGFYVKGRNMYCVTFAVSGGEYLIDVWVIVKRKNPFFRLLGYRWLVDHVNFKSDYFSNCGRITINGVDHAVPNDVEAYLEELYGTEWKIPLKNRTAGPRSLLSQWLNAPFVDFKMPPQFSGDNSVGTFKPWFSFLLKRLAPNSRLCGLFKHPE